MFGNINLGAARNKLGTMKAKAACLALVALPMLASAADGDATASITEAKTVILGIVAAAGAAMIAVSLAGVGWSVGSKFIKRIGGKA